MSERVRLGTAEGKERHWIFICPDLSPSDLIDLLSEKPCGECGGTGWSVERVYVYWDKPRRPPRPGEQITLDDGRRAKVDTARASDGAIEKRKLTAFLPCSRCTLRAEIRELLGASQELREED